MSKVKLIFKGVSEIVGTQEIGLLILVDEQERRQLTIPCDQSMLYQFGLRIKHAPVVDKLLPEVLWQVLSTQTEMRFEIIINNLIEGQFRAMLYNLDTLEPVSMRASDAVLLSYISKIPLYIESGLMDKQSVDYDEKSRNIPLPVNTISDEMLSSALEKAIKDENYELASHLRDEILKRKSQRGETSDMINNSLI
jgi:bifunctional DNase/RNase